MGDENPIRTLGDYSKPSHEGYRNTIELPVGNNVVPLRSDTIRLVQNECLFHRLRSEDPNQHLKDFLKLVDSHDLDCKTGKERSITTWEDLTARFLAQFFPPGRTAKLCIDILMFQQHHEEYISEAWTRFKDLLQKNNPRDFAKTVKAIALPKYVPSTSDRHIIELENQVQCLMESHLVPTQPTQVNKITTSCEICSGPNDTQYCMEDPEQAFVEYASSRTDEARGKWYTFKTEQINLGDTYNPSWRSHPRWRQPQNSQNNFCNPPNWFQPNDLILNRFFNNNTRSFNNQSNLEGLVSNFMASQDARLKKFGANFKHQQSEMTNKIDTALKAIIDRIVGALPSDTVKNLKLSTSLVLTTRSYPNMDPQCSNHIQGSINAVIIYSEKQSNSYDEKAKENKEEEKDSPENIHVNPSTPLDPSVSFITEKVLKFNSFFESLGLVPQSSDTDVVCTKGDNREVMFIELIRKNDDFSKGEPEEEGSTTTKGVGPEYFDMFPTRSELAYHKYLMCSPIPSIFLKSPIITKRKLDPRENSYRGVRNFTGRIKGMYVFVENFTYIVDFMIVEDISSIIDPRLSQVVLWKPFIEVCNTDVLAKSQG
uniref:MAK10-like protein n=1 Tax=Tanacetum cinerariifolium TaxID=118510 RepID=A0A6L2MVC7_TANCI|nr:MAK10-like protein [Tanacetum cinerariifolium]